MASLWRALPRATRKTSTALWLRPARLLTAARGPSSRPSERGRMIWKLADLLEQNTEEFATLETLDNGKPLNVARAADVPLAVDCLRYFAGWATKLEGNTIPHFRSLCQGREVPGVHYAQSGGRGGTDHPVGISRC